MSARTRTIVLLLLLMVGIGVSTGMAASPPRMRPYVGIGVVVYSGFDEGRNQDVQLQLYEEPGLVRMKLLTGAEFPGNEWIFGQQEGGAPLIVSARKGEWLRVFFDDAGREAWINPQDKWRFLTWEQYLKQHTGRLLSALQPQYYQLLQQPGGKQLATLTPKQLFKVLKLDNSWGMVLTDKGLLGWLRWRDSDGRLTFGIGKN